MKDVKRRRSRRIRRITKGSVTLFLFGVDAPDEQAIHSLNAGQPVD
jgi:hypothetical protein